MPKRTNEFQKLVFMVKQHAVSGATVTESKYLQDRNTGTQREVDICIESLVAGHSVTVSIECRDRGRKESVQWIEEMKAKHERLPTNVLVLVSSSGFTKEALSVAHSYGIETAVLSALNDSSAERLFGDTSFLSSMVITLSPMQVLIRLAAEGGIVGEEIYAIPKNDVYNHKGEIVANVRELVENLLHARYIIEKFGKLRSESHKGFEVHCEPVRDQEGNPLCLKKINPYVLRPMEFVRITGACSIEISHFSLRNGILDDVKIAWGTGTLLGKDALLVASEDQSKTKKISISTEDVTLMSPTKQSTGGR